MKKIKRILICAVLITVCFLLETTVFQKLAFASIIPNLLIIVTSSFGFMRGQKEGMIIGFFCGLLKDILGGNLLGFYALIPEKKNMPAYCSDMATDFSREYFMTKTSNSRWHLLPAASFYMVW